MRSEAYAGWLGEMNTEMSMRPMPVEVESKFDQAK